MKILADQSQTQTKTEPKRTSDPKHIIQTRDKNNISKSIKRKDAKQRKLDDDDDNTDTFTYNANTEMIALNGICSIKVQLPIQERSKPFIDKTSEHDNSIYYGNYLLFFNAFYLMLLLNFRLFISFFLPIFLAISIKNPNVYFIFLSFCFF